MSIKSGFYDATDKPHLSEWKGKDGGSTTNSDFREQGRNNVLSPKTEETQLATLSSKSTPLNT